MRKANSYTQLGLAVFFTVSALLLFYDTFFGSRAGLELLGRFIEVAMPVLYGIGIAYLLAPVVDICEGLMFGSVAKGTRRKVPSGFARGTSLFVTWVIIGGMFYWLLSVLLPELYLSVIQLGSNVETYYDTINGWIQQLLKSSPEAESWVLSQMDSYYKTMTTWVKDTLIPQAQTIVGAVSGGIMSVYTFVQNVVVGSIVSIYILATKETLGAHARKVSYGIFSQKNIYWVLRGTRKVDAIFSGFIRGKILDSLIIGVLAFISCNLLGFPYVPLVSVIIGVTNVIPFFGPFLGAIPCFFLILLVSPMQSLYFLIFVIVLQQLDGNVIGPMILGDKTGLPGFFVIVAILIGGGFFGLAGMFFGVPVFACVYSFIRFWLETRLKAKELPLDTESYTGNHTHITPYKDI